MRWPSLRRQSIPEGDHRAAADLAAAAGQVLLDLRVALDDPAYDPAAVRAAGDRASHEFLVAALPRDFPDHGVLSEEGVDDAGRLTARVWIVDPLDGTREFGEAGRTDWAVQVALVIDGQVVAAAVALSALGTTLS